MRDSGKINLNHETNKTHHFRIVVEESTSYYDYFRQADGKSNPNAAKLWENGRVEQKTLLQIGKILNESSNVVYFGQQFVTEYDFPGFPCIFGSAPDARNYFEVGTSMALPKGELGCAMCMVDLLLWSNAFLARPNAFWPTATVGRN